MQKEEEKMDYAIKILESERISIISALKNGQSGRYNKVDNAGKYNFEPLPFIEGYGGFTNYRIMIDKETEDCSLWEEYKKTDGSCFLLDPGDFILEAK